MNADSMSRDLVYSPSSPTRFYNLIKLIMIIIITVTSFPIILLASRGLFLNHGSPTAAFSGANILRSKMKLSFIEKSMDYNHNDHIFYQFYLKQTM